MSSVTVISAGHAAKRYATIWPRFWAVVVDFVVLSPILIFSYYVKHHVQNPVLLGSTIVLNYSCAIVYSVAMHTRYGQTLGKMVMHVRVLNLNETRIPSFREAILMKLYNIVSCICMIGIAIFMIASHTYSPHAYTKTRFFTVLLYVDYCWLFLDLICLLIHRKHRAIHDLIAGTVVVRTIATSNIETSVDAQPLS